MSFSAGPIVLGVAAVGLLSVTCLQYAPRIVWNVTASVPVGLYIVRSFNVLEVGDLVAVRLPYGQNNWLSERGYIPANSMLIKEVAAVAGARVCRTGAEVTIDGRYVATAREFDAQGRRLPRWEGCIVLANDQVFLLVRENPSSLDGRYFGPTPVQNVIGLARPIWFRGAEL